ncbi:testin-like isoform X1 [Acanthaster planci]|uniref:Testin-like isoform X1 n=1 Tax=Acanthaster planci TaxID=133434 RepID=A0A8B7ZTT3_ACAPL|nr:testin-like isoform X1 [Acanthaster planci]
MGEVQHDAGDSPYESIAKIDTSKKEVVLGHEIGSGSKCLKCGDACTGLELHFWRRICKICKCSPEDHAVQIKEHETVRKVGRLFDSTNYKKYTVDKMTIEHTEMMAKPEAPVIGNAEPSKNITFEWIPQGATEKMVKRYMEMIPIENQPVEGTEGAQRRAQQMQKQLPDHDQQPELCQQLNTEEAERMLDFVKDYKEKAVGIGQVQPVVPHKVPQLQMQSLSLEESAPAPQGHPGAPDGVQGMDHEPEKTSVGVGEDTVPPKAVGEAKWKCCRCNQGMTGGDVAVFAERAGNDKCWHPGCFRCRTCNELLVDLIYFYKDDDIFCGRHYADLLKPRCAACDELIFSEKYTLAEELSWHIDHFCCWNCDTVLGGRRYVARESHPYCLPCYDKLFAKYCGTCNQKIEADSKRLNHENNFWHADAACFKCSSCAVSLVGRSFLPKDRNIFCSVQCKRKYFNQ